MRVEPLKVSVRTSFVVEVMKTEDPEKVRRAVLNILPGIEVREGASGRMLTGESSDPSCLTALYEQIRARRIAGVVRRLYEEHLVGERSWLYFNKQAAYAGSVVVCEDPSESPLGPIKVYFECSDKDLFLDWLAPL